MNLLITGGAGFIGSNLVRYWLGRHPQDTVVTLDKLIHLPEPLNLQDCLEHPRFRFVQGDMSDRDAVFRLFEEHSVEGVIHAAAQSNNDRAIQNPEETVRWNVMGTLTLLEATRHFLHDKGRFHHVSTDEVFGALEPGEDAFREQTPYAPNNPYSASKAAGDHLVRAYYRTFGMNAVTTNCSNNYGPRQYPNSFIPRMISHALAGEPLPVYGTGRNVRDWLFVEDHCRAIDAVFHDAASGTRYCVGGHSEQQNIEVVARLCRLLDERLDKPEGTTEQLITFVKDRPGHDFRYALDSSKIRRDLGWKPTVPFEEGLARTVDWYVENQDWMRRVAHMGR